MNKNFTRHQPHQVKLGSLKSYLWILVVSMIFGVSCEESSTGEDSDLPTVTTTPVSELTSTGAITGGNVTDGGASEVLSRGVCLGTKSNPAIETDTKTSDGKGNGSFTSVLTNLTPSTKYYVRAYATNDAGIAYGTEISFNTPSGEITPPSILDADGNSYSVVRIGTQDWTVQNWRSTRYNDGTAIPKVTDNDTWSNLETGAYCSYDNTDANSADYGNLYNWYAVNSGKLAPATGGWRVPTAEDWKKLAAYLGGFDEAGKKMMETGISYWVSPNSEATNTSGFSARPNGVRNYFSGNFDYLTYRAYWWSSTNTSTAYAPYYSIRANEIQLREVTESDKTNGYGVRLVRDVP